MLTKTLMINLFMKMFKPLDMRKRKKISLLFLLFYDFNILIHVYVIKGIYFLSILIQIVRLILGPLVSLKVEYISNNFQSLFSP